MSLCNHLAETSLCPMCRDDLELQTLRTRNAELEKELARVKGQRDGLAKGFRVQRLIDSEQVQSVRRRWIYQGRDTLDLAEDILHEIAQERAGEGR